MIRKLFRTGRTLAASVPEECARALDLAEGDYLTVEVDAGARALLIWPAAIRAAAIPQAEFRRQLAAYLEAYGPALAALEAAAGAAPPTSNPADGEPQA